MKHIVISFLYIFLFISTNEANSNSVFESSFIKIEINTNNAYETKLKSIEEIKIKSLLVIANKILDDRNKRKFVKLLNQKNFINKFVQNIIIENEIITNQKYIAEIKVNYDKKKIINILRDYKINYSDIVPPPYLLISSYNQEFINIGLERNNLFIKQFKVHFNSKNYLLNYFFPKLDPNDRYILSYEKMIIEDKNAYKKLLDKYNLDQAFYVKINQNKLQNKVKVLMKFFDKNINKFKLIEQFEYFIEDNNNNDSTLNLLSEDILYKLDNWWKKDNLINNSKINSIKCIIKSKNFDDFNFIKSNINDLSQVLTMRRIKIKINHNVEKIEYYGDINILTKSLLSKGVTLVDPDNCSILSN